MNKIRELFLGNFSMKLLSFLIAVIFWFITMNINNPTIEKDVTVPLTFKNESVVSDSGLVVVNYDDLEDTTLQVKYRGKRNDIESLRRYENAIVASIDFKTIDLTNEALLGQEISVPISVYTNYPSTFTVVSYYPISVLVKIDTLSTKTVPIYVDTEGQPKDTYVLQGSPSLSKTSLTITGPKTTLDKINKIVVELDVTDASNDISEDLKPIAIDDDGVDLSEYIYSGLEDITVTQKVAKATTVEVLIPSLTGEVPDGYNLIDYSIDKTQIDVLANESNENLSFNPIVLNDISLEDLTETKSFTEDITEKLDAQGLKVENAGDEIITTTVNIESDVEKTLSVPVSYIVFSEVDYTYSIGESNVSMTIKAAESVVDTITVDDFAYNCKLKSDYEAGWYACNIDVTSPENVEIVKKPVVHINVVTNETEE